MPVIEDYSNGRSRHIPVKFGLVGPDGKDVVDQLLELTGKERTFKFENIPAGSVPSILRNFSAPVNLEASYSDDELQHLMVHDSDGFNQWEAGNHFMKSRPKALSHTNASSSF